MDVELRTYCANPALAFRDLERWPEAYPEIPAGWRARLQLRSGAFAAELPFYFDQRVLDAFLRDLAGMDRTLTGSATLSTPHEGPRITFTVGPQGGVAVSGLLLDYEHDYQRLEFEFRTDQTVLRPLVEDFEHASQVLVAAAPAASRGVAVDGVRRGGAARPPSSSPAIALRLDGPATELGR